LPKHQNHYQVENDQKEKYQQTPKQEGKQGAKGTHI
jgi:hypothetical protein